MTNRTVLSNEDVHPFGPDYERSTSTVLSKDSDTGSKLSVKFSKDYLVYASPPLTPVKAWTSLQPDEPQPLNADSMEFVKKSETINHQIHHLVKAFAARIDSAKRRLKRPLTPEPVVESDSSSEDDDDDSEDDLYKKLDTVFLLEHSDDETLLTPFKRKTKIQKSVHKIKRRLHRAVDSQGNGAIAWQFFVMSCFLYNGWCILLRSVFPYQEPWNLSYWLLVDYTTDFMYVLDIVVYRMRTKILSNGVWLDDLKSIRKAYLRSQTFVLDISSLMPLDILYLYFGVVPILRLPRLLKFHVFTEFFNKCDRQAKSPYVVRIIRTMVYMLFLIHVNACAYYGYSDYCGIGTNAWVYDGNGNAYIRCFLFALKTATSIGKNPKPTEENQYIFMTISWLMGVFIFAIMIGQIKDIINTASKRKRENDMKMDRIHEFMERLHLPKTLQERVILWFDHMWEENKGIDEVVVLDYLPRKTRSDVALSVHYHSLKKVALFKGLQRDLLRDLVLKLQPVLFLPGDFIFRKGQVGREMFIVNSGFIQVLGGPSGREVVVTLGEGSAFGEISLLSIGGGNRRTADVQAKGFAELFVLNRDCLEDTVRDYPEAQEILQRKAKKLINSRMKKAKPPEKEPSRTNSIVIPLEGKHETPKMVETVLKMMKPTSATAQRLRSNSNASRDSASIN